MNDKPEVPNSGSDPYSSGETSRPETARTPASGSDGTPTVNIGGSYSSTPSPDAPAPYADPYSWKPGQYNAGNVTGGQGQPNSPLPPQPATNPLPQSQYTPPTQYAPPPQYNAGNVTGGQGQPNSPLPPQPATNPLPQSQYTPPTQYAPPPQYNPAQYPQGQPTQYMPPALQQPYQTAYPQQQQGQYPPYAYAAPPKDPTVGLLLELIGYLGFLGIGHIYAGKTTRGIALLFGYWAYIFISVVLTIVLVGCIMLLATLVVPILSGFYLKNEMEREQAAMGIRRY